MHGGSYGGPGTWPYGGPSELPSTPPAGALPTLPVVPLTMLPVHRPKRRRRVLVATLSTVTVSALVVVAVATRHPSQGQSLPLVGSGTSSSADPSASSSTGAVDAAKRDHDLAALMSRLATALTRGDLTGWLADVDPQQPALVAHQRQLFANLHQLPFGRFELVPSPAAAPTFFDVPVSVSSTFTDDQATYSAPYILRYQLRGFDKSVVTHDLAPIFLERHGAWLLAGDQTASVATDLRTEPWDGGPIKVARGRHTLVVVAASDAKALPKLVRQAEAAVQKVTAMWSGGWSHQAVLYDIRGSDLFTKYLGSGRNSTDFDGVTLGLGKDGITAAQEDLRVVANPAYAAPGSKVLPALLAHEFTHVAKWADRASGTPLWAIEGIAEYTAYRGHPQDQRVSSKIGSDGRKGRLPKSLPSAQGFYAGATVAYDYGIAWLTFEYLKERYGENKVRQLYERLATIKGDADTVAAHAAENQAFRAVLHMSEAKFITGLNKWIGQVIRPVRH